MEPSIDKLIIAMDNDRPTIAMQQKKKWKKE